MQNNLTRTEQLLGSPKNIIGNTNADLILESLGKIYLKTGKKTRLLNDVFNLLDEINKSPDLNSKVLIVPNLQNIKYPGDGMLVFDKSNNALYITYDQRYLLIIDSLGQTAEGTYVKKTGDTMSGQLVIKHTGAPLIVYSKDLCRNLNANYLNGYTQEDFARRNVEEHISAPWTFEKDVNFNQDVHIKNNLDVGNTITSKNIIGDDYTVNNSIGSAGDFIGGFSGQGWKLENIDGYGYRLTVDYLVVRKAMMVYELIISRISATNGSLWVTDSATVESFYELNTEEKSDKWYYKNNEVLTLGIPVKYHKGEKTLGLSDTELVGLQQEMVFLNSEGSFEFVYLWKKYFSEGSKYVIVTKDDKIPTLGTGDIIRCQKFQDNCIKFYEGIVLARLGDYEYAIQLAPSVFYEPNEDYGDNLEQLTSVAENDDLVRVGNIYNLDRQNSLFLTSSEVDSPYIRTMTGVNRPDWSVVYTHPDYKKVNGKYITSQGTTYEYLSSDNYKDVLLSNDTTLNNPENLDTPVIKSNFVRAQFGKLDSVEDSHFPSNRQPSGYGLYSDNVYLKGEFYLNDGTAVADISKEGIILALKDYGLEIIEQDGEGIVNVFGDKFTIYTDSSKSEKLLWVDKYGLHVNGTIEIYYDEIDVTAEKLENEQWYKYVSQIKNIDANNLRNLRFFISHAHNEYNIINNNTVLVNLPIQWEGNNNSIQEITIKNDTPSYVEPNGQGVNIEKGCFILLYPGLGASTETQEGFTQDELYNYLINSMRYQGRPLQGVALAPGREVTFKVTKSSDGTILWDLISQANYMYDFSESRGEIAALTTTANGNSYTSTGLPSFEIFAAKYNQHYDEYGELTYDQGTCPYSLWNHKNNRATGLTLYQNMDNSYTIKTNYTGHTATVDSSGLCLAKVNSNWSLKNLALVNVEVGGNTEIVDGVTNYLGSSITILDMYLKSKFSFVVTTSQNTQAVDICFPTSQDNSIYYEAELILP